MKRNSLLLSFVIFSLLTTFNTNGKVPCERYLNNTEVTICDCLKNKKDNEKLFLCIEQKHDEMYASIKESTYGKTWTEDGKMWNFGWEDWAETELSYINSLDYNDKNKTRIRQIIYRQNLYQSYFSMLRNRGLLFGGSDLSSYLNLIKKYDSMSLKGYSLDGFEQDNPSPKYALFVEKELSSILQKITDELSLTHPAIKNSQQKWLEFFDNLVEDYKKENKMKAGSLSHRCIVLDDLKERIYCLVEYANENSDLSWQRLNRFPIGQVDLYELLTGEEIEYSKEE